MSDDTNQTPPAQGEQEQSKHRKPDHYVQLEMQQGNGRKRLMDVGELWQGKNGYQTGNTIYGRMVIQPRAQREALKELREQKAQSIEQGQTKNIDP